ncbi:hypothetical protein [Vibrio lentus]|uniref:hypothetical protein n=1 Tax=Vibrio lentus TaxID=136468 RepID=UPI000C851DD0|nr:hypothetical protein [Vibrio lentus]PMH89819.1 hypothetical protein BCU56_19100 [Vibrio lentus]
MSDFFSKDLEKTVSAVRNNKFLLRSNSNFEPVGGLEPYGYQATPKYYNNENEAKIDKFLKDIYGKEYLCSQKTRSEKELACLKVLKFLSQNSYIDTRTVTDRSYDTPCKTKNTRVHLFSEFSLSEKGLEIYFKIKARDSSKKSFILSFLALIIALMSAFYSAYSTNINEKRLEMQVEAFCKESKDSSFCKN